MAIELNTYEQIRFLKERHDYSQRKVAELLHLSRNTVRKYWNGENVPWERKTGSGTTKHTTTEEVVSFVKECICHDGAVKNKKQHHTAKRIFDRLVAERNFKGSESTIRNLVAELKRNQPQKVFVPLVYAPGEAIQVDFGEATFYLNEEKRKINLWCMRECYSDAFYVECFVQQNTESFLQGMQNGFEYFNGVPEKVIFDNGRVAVKEGFGLHAKCTDKYAAFSAHYAFKPIFCNIASGHEKGLVEGLVGFIRRNVFVPLPHVKSIDELNQLLKSASQKYMQHLVKSKEKRVEELLSESQMAMAELPVYRMDVSNTSIRRVDEFSTVSFDHNKYSVPFRLSNKEVTVKGNGNTVKIIYNRQTVASYQRDYAYGKVHYDLNHYIDLIEKRPRSAINAQPVKNCIPETLYNFLRQLDNPKTIVKVLRYYLTREKDVLSALKSTQNIAVFEKLMSETPSCCRLNIPDEIKVNLPNINQYDRLIKGDAL